MKFLLSLLLLGLQLFSSEAFITPKQLKEKLDNKNLVILDTTDTKVFNEGHIPNAISIDAGKFRHQVGKYQLINSSSDIQTLAQSLGINNDSEVVLYGHNIDKDILKASYIALALVANGLENVSILNGGYPDWVSEYEFDNLISKKTTTPKRGNFKANFDANILVDKDYVLDRIGKVAMIEARPSEYYYGKKQSPGVKRLGHIPKAKSSYWRDKFDIDYRVRKDSELKAIYLDNNFLNKNKEVITYCTGGLEASMNWYILTQHLKFKDVKIYDASMREWGNLDDTPLVK
ncbi:thiosulfate sulfurtransferase [Sulfurimonas aquatica]|uniref:Thiosulfate sulfurtransferase n=1 Tax=Sulfurimonas aquatica TaxID=2672570 RepID=A0A975GBR3_9BACT|nr:rhodanese-like domain-containing protein [Sulfurimonas aquatica]QSZ40956.1 thiosulfate sulfurtransferase [Sulfurimonas aquatica]